MTEWHLFPEEKPREEFREYLITYIDEDNKKQVCQSGYFMGKFHDIFTEQKKGVVAWAEMPEPYSGI